MAFSLVKRADKKQRGIKPRCFLSFFLIAKYACPRKAAAARLRKILYAVADEIFMAKYDIP